MSAVAAPVSFAKLYGEPVIELPHDLYIPPDALEVILEAFEGPLDLLLYLIRKENLDILDIPMAPLTRQYLEYVEIMRTKNLELAAEYLVMAAMLMAIKSRLLLARPPSAQARPRRGMSVSASARARLTKRKYFWITKRPPYCGNFTLTSVYREAGKVSWALRVWAGSLLSRSVST